MEENKAKAPKRIVFNVTPELHIRIKTHASMRGISITQWILSAIVDRIKKDSLYE